MFSHLILEGELMKYIPIILCIAALMVLLFFVMRRLDRFLAENNRYIMEHSNYKSDTVKIAVERNCDLSVLSQQLELYSRSHPGEKICILSAGADEIRKGIDNGKLDIGIVFSEAPDDAAWECKKRALILSRRRVSGENEKNELLKELESMILSSTSEVRF